MGYRIRVVPEVEVWLGELRGDDPGAADLIDKALDTLREAGAGLGPPMVVPVEEPPRPALLEPDLSYQRQLEMLTRVRRGVADAATGRKRLELEIHRLEEELTTQALEPGDENATAAAKSDRLADLRRQYAAAQSEEERLLTASQQLQAKIDNARIRKQAVAGQPGNTRELRLSDLRPGAPESAGIRILFTVEPPDTALLLAAGTERDWLRAWYTETALSCRARYERYRGNRD
jgi:hypothetical protein